MNLVPGLLFGVVAVGIGLGVAAASCGVGG